jgi:hypothetical protein
VMTLGFSVFFLAWRTLIVRTSDAGAIGGVEINRA